MFIVNEDLSIYVTRGDIVFFTVSADDNGILYKFQPGDIVRMAIYGRKDAESCVMQKDFPVTEVSETVFIYLDEEDTKIGDIISKHKDYWYEVVLNPDTMPQTIIGYDEDGAKIFRLFPESEEIDDNYDPKPEDFPVVDEELDMTSPRPIANKVVAQNFATVLDVCERTNKAVAELYVTPEMFGAIADGKSDDYESIMECVAYAEDNGLCVRFMSKVYAISQPVVVTLSNVIYGNNAVLKAIAEMDTVLAVNKPTTAMAGEKYHGCSAIYDLNIDGNSFADKGVFVQYGKGITLKNVRVKAAKTAQMKICDSGQQVWELNVENVELRCEHSGGYSPYGLLIESGTTDSYFRNILIVNSSQSWVDSGSAACSFEDVHGYGYPVELAANNGFVFRGNGNFIRNISVDTPMNKGIVVDGDYNIFSEIAVGNMQSANGRGIEVNGNANSFDGVRCSSHYCFYLTSGSNTVEEFKCTRLQSKSVYDYYFTGKLPYRGVLDTKTEVTNNIRKHFAFNNKWFYQSVKEMEIDFGIEHRYNNYNVRLEGVEESAPNYSLVKTTTGCTITCTDAITSGKKVNVIIDSPGVSLV